MKQLGIREEKISPHQAAVCMKEGKKKMFPLEKAPSLWSVNQMCWGWVQILQCCLMNGSWHTSRAEEIG